MTLKVDIAHSFGTFDLNARFSAPEGVTVLFGRSGSGKTSVVRAIAGLLCPDNGQISVAGVPVFDSKTRLHLPPHKRRMGYIFQDSRLFPHLSVAQNLTYGQRLAPLSGDAPGFDDIVALLGLGALLPRRPHALSGGETQRVAIGRALLSNPRMILADEPLAALDQQRKAEILPYFEMLRDTVQIPTLYVSHNAAEVARLATTVVVLDNGRVTQQGPADHILSDAAITPLGARSAGAVITARVLAHHPDALTEVEAGDQRLFLPQIDAPIGGHVRLRIPAHDIILFDHAPTGLSALNVLEGTISGLRDGTGPGVLVAIDTSAGALLARVTRRSAQAMQLRPGQTVFAVMKSVALSPQDVGTQT